MAILSDEAVKSYQKHNPFLPPTLNGAKKEDLFQLYESVFLPNCTVISQLEVFAIWIFSNAVVTDRFLKS